MAQQKTQRRTGSRTEYKAYWQQPWVQRVLRGKYNFFEKMVFMRTASFGASGCWMYNENYAGELGCCERYVIEAITNLWKGGEFWITGWNSRNRCIYAAHNPEVKAMAEERYKAELKARTVTDKDDFYRKNKTRGYKTLNNSAGLDEKNPEQEYRVRKPTLNNSAGLGEL